jgi:hypothetical protein
MNATATAANLAWCAASLPSYFAFRAALNDPRRAQRELLRRYVRDNADTAFGREHHFDRIDSVESFRRHVPLLDYDAISGWVDHIAAGEPNVLTCDPVTRLIPSSGSTRAAKRIPYTATLQAEFNRAVGPWIIDLFRRIPSVAGGCAYWSISPATPTQHQSTIPVGYDDDAAYLGGLRKRLVGAVMAVPGGVRHINDVDAFRFATALHLLDRPDLRLISVWHPSFLELLLDAIESRWDELLNALCKSHPTRAAQLRRTAQGHWGEFWPNLRVVSCWADAHAAGPAEALRQRLPGCVGIEPKGLLATEAFVSVPFAGAWPLAVLSHFFEFLDDRGRALEADELQPGHEYAVAVTTAGGLYRYRLGDRVRYDAFVGRTPSVRFVGRDDLVVDRFGEKLNEAFVGGSIRTWLSGLNKTATFAMLAPTATANRPRYTLYIQTNSELPPDAPERLDAALCENPHYAYCRRLGQLARVRVRRVAGEAYAAYVTQKRATGRKLGEIKPVALDSGDWERVFEPAEPARVAV